MKRRFYPGSQLPILKRENRGEYRSNEPMWVRKGACSSHPVVAAKDDLMGSVVQRDVFGVARRVSSVRLFMRCPGNHAGTKREAIAFYGATG
jgi:hypothetical protein